jgi:hypothetical protein
VSETKRSDEPREYWFNTKTGEVEIGKQVAALYRIGPFSTFEEAKNALRILAERSQAWRNEDSAEN